MVRESIRCLAQEDIDLYHESDFNMRHAKIRVA